MVKIVERKMGTVASLKKAKVKGLHRRLGCLPAGNPHHCSRLPWSSDLMILSVWLPSRASLLRQTGSGCKGPQDSKNQSPRVVLLFQSFQRSPSWLRSLCSSQLTRRRELESDLWPWPHLQSSSCTGMGGLHRQSRWRRTPCSLRQGCRATTLLLTQAAGLC